MIGRLAGTLLEKQPDRVVIDVGGVGYLVSISFQTFQELPAARSEAALWIHTHVREDALALFGFASEKEKRLFEMLISVSGVGPRMALTLLSGIPAAELLSSLAKGDAKRLTSVPGIGKKTADRLTLELREKAEKLRAPGEPVSGIDPEDVVSALVNFGYKRSEADRVVEAIVRQGAPADFSEFLKRALSALSGS
jgi:Holliday junction DNA helicase RuvA